MTARLFQRRTIRQTGSKPELISVCKCQALCCLAGHYQRFADTYITAFLEHAGIEYDIITDELLDREGVELLQQYQAVISSTHHEYVAGESVGEIAEYTASGGRFLYAGANGSFWALVLAKNEPLKPKIEDVKLTTLPVTIAYHPADSEPWAEAHMVFFETPRGGAALAACSIAWMGSAVTSNFDNDVATITRNIIKRFLDPTPFPMIQQNEVGTFDRVPSNPEYEWTDHRAYIGPSDFAVKRRSCPVGSWNTRKPNCGKTASA